MNSTQSSIVAERSANLPMQPLTTESSSPLVVFVTDIGFLVPSLVAAKQLVAQGIHKIADIVIYTVNVDADLIAALSRDPATRHIRFESLPYDLFAPPPEVNFHKSHVPVTSLARLALQEVIPATYDGIVYIDGDVQIVGDVSALVKCRVPEGKILAGRGSAWLDIGRSAGLKTPADYLAGLGGVSETDYFNAGVLAFSRTTWSMAAPKALQFFFDHSDVCIRHDQSALNAVFNGNVIGLAPRYNFHSVYADLHVQDRYKPSIIHFTGPKKPWGHVSPPWGSRFQRSYRRLVSELPVLERHLTIHDAGPLRSLVRDVKSSITERRRVKAESEEIAARRQAFFAYVEATRFIC
jgi:lipopolysaccharide biosynthesis glycosyltransferase